MTERVCGDLEIQRSATGERLLQEGNGGVEGSLRNIYALQLCTVLFRAPKEGEIEGEIRG